MVIADLSFDNIGEADLSFSFLGIADVAVVVAGAIGGFDDSDVAFDWEDFAFDEG